MVWSCPWASLRRTSRLFRVSGKDGKTEVTTDQFSSPICDPRFIFELLINAETLQKDGKGGYLHITKISHETLFDCLPKENEQVTIAHGEALARWCASAGGSVADKPAPHASTTKGDLWKACVRFMGVPKPSVGDVEKALVDAKVLGAGMTLAGLSEHDSREVIDRINILMAERSGQ